MNTLSQDEANSQLLMHQYMAQSQIINPNQGGNLGMLKQSDREAIN